MPAYVHFMGGEAARNIILGGADFDLPLIISVWISYETNPRVALKNLFYQ